MIPSHYNLFQNTEAEGTCSNSFHEANIIPKPDNGIPRKENYRPISLRNTDAKTLSKMLTNQIQQCMKRITHHDQWDLV